MYGFHFSHTEGNLLTAAACARGFIEAAGDADYTLAVVPVTLAKNHANVGKALSGTLTRGSFVSQELEDLLIHFTHARKPEKGEALPRAHVALQVAQYRSRLETFEPAVSKYYAWLCDLTHPGASSVLSYAESLTETASRIRFSLNAERTNLEVLRARLESVIPKLLMFGVNPALATLKLLNTFSIRRLHTRYMKKVDMSETPLWQKVCALIGGAV